MLSRSRPCRTSSSFRARALTSAGSLPARSCPSGAARMRTKWRLSASSLNGRTMAVRIRRKPLTGVWRRLPTLEEISRGSRLHAKVQRAVTLPFRCTQSRPSSELISLRIRNPRSPPRRSRRMPRQSPPPLGCRSCRRRRCYMSRCDTRLPTTIRCCPGPTRHTFGFRRSRR